MEKKSIFDDSTFAEMLNRIESLTPETGAEWGSMDVAQMLAHCAEIQEVGNGKSLVGTPFIVKLLKRFILKMVLKEKPYPHSKRTHPQFIITDSKDFEEQKARLIDALEKLKAAGPVSKTHPVFGDMSGEERGWISYKHLDHHLTQFGV